MITFDGPLTVHHLRQQLNECRPLAEVEFIGAGRIVAMTHEGTTVTLIGGKRAMNKAAAAERAARRGDVAGTMRITEVTMMGTESDDHQEGDAPDDEEND